jgi:uridylate kinase
MLKVSGEALQGSVGFGIDPQVGSRLAAHHRTCSTISRRFADTMCWDAKGAAGVP